jgi:hypothetical protein
MSFSNQQTERNKLINRMKITPIPQHPHPFIMDVLKKSLDIQSGIPKRLEIKIKIPKLNKTSTHTYPGSYQLPTEGERLGE